MAESGLVGMKGYLKTYNHVKYFLPYLSSFSMRLLFTPNFQDSFRAIKPKYTLTQYCQEIWCKRTVQLINLKLKSKFHAARPNHSQVLSKSLKLRTH